MVDVTRTRNGYWQQVDEIFHQALDMPLDARAAFVHERCGGDAVMEREVLGTLAGYEAQDRISALRAAKSIEGARYGAFAKTDIDLSIWRRHIHPHAGFKQGEIHDPPLTFQPFGTSMEKACSWLSCMETQVTFCAPAVRARMSIRSCVKRNRVTKKPSDTLCAIER